MEVILLAFVGVGGLVISFLITIYHWEMNTAVSSYSPYSGSTSVHNVGLMNDRIVGVIVGVGWTIASLIVLAVAKWLQDK